MWGEILWAALLATCYAAILSLVLAGCHALGFVALDFRALAPLAPVLFVAGCAFASLGLFFTAVAPTIDHMNLPVFLFVLPLAIVSGTYFPLADPRLAPLRAISPLYHLAEGARGLLLGRPRWRTWPPCWRWRPPCCSCSSRSTCGCSAAASSASDL